MKLHLVDTNTQLVRCWGKAFSQHREVEIIGGDILDMAHTAIVSPANSFGFMDGGIDLAYSNYFGPNVQEGVFWAISTRPEGFLPVGASLMVRTEHPKIPYLIVAPTMKLPGPVAAPFSPPEQHKERTRQKFLQSLSFPVSDLLPWKLLITTELTKTKKFGDLKKHCSNKRLDYACKIIHLLQMETEEKIRLTQEKPFGNITLESLQKQQNASITVTDENGRKYSFDWQDLTDGQQKKIITDIHKHRILCKTA